MREMVEEDTQTELPSVMPRASKNKSASPHVKSRTSSDDDDDDDSERKHRRSKADKRRHKHDRQTQSPSRKNLSYLHIFTARRYASARSLVDVRCPSVCPSR